MQERSPVRELETHAVNHELLARVQRRGVCLSSGPASATSDGSGGERADGDVRDGRLCGVELDKEHALARDAAQGGVRRDQPRAVHGQLCAYRV